MALSVKEIKQKYFEKIYSEAIEVDCACGCGILIKNKDKYGRDKKFVSGHNSKKYEDPKEYKRQYVIRNREKLRRKNSIWKKNNRQYGAAQSALRRARKKKCTPPWANILEIRQFYVACPEGMTVDHVIPIKNNLVCGLHVLHNLQYLTGEENSKKNNQFEICHTKS